MSRWSGLALMVVAVGMAAYASVRGEGLVGSVAAAGVGAAAIGALIAVMVGLRGERAAC